MDLQYWGSKACTPNSTPARLRGCAEAPGRPGGGTTSRGGQLAVTLTAVSAKPPSTSPPRSRRYGPRTRAVLERQAKTWKLDSLEKFFESCGVPADKDTLKALCEMTKLSTERVVSWLRMRIEQGKESADSAFRAAQAAAGERSEMVTPEPTAASKAATTPAACSSADCSSARGAARAEGSRSGSRTGTAAPKHAPRSTSREATSRRAARDSGAKDRRGAPHELPHRRSRCSSR